MGVRIPEEKAKIGVEEILKKQGKKKFPLVSALVEDIVEESIKDPISDESLNDIISDHQQKPGNRIERASYYYNKIINAIPSDLFEETESIVAEAFYQKALTPEFISNLKKSDERLREFSKKKEKNKEEISFDEEF